MGQVCCTTQGTAHIIKIMIDHGYSGMDEGTKVHHFLQDIKSTELQAVLNDVWAQPEKYGKEFDATVCYLCQMFMRQGKTM